MGKCESRGTSMKDSSGIQVRVINLNRPPRVCPGGAGGSGEPPYLTRIRARANRHPSEFQGDLRETRIPQYSGTALYSKFKARKSSRGSSKLQLPNDLTNLRRSCSRFVSIFHSRHAKKSSANKNASPFSSSSMAEV